MFSLINGGCFSRHSTDFFMNRPNGLPHYLFLIIRSDSELVVNGTPQTIKPNSVLIIRPNTPYSYHNPHGDYLDDWLHFECSSEDLALLPDTILNHGFPIQNPALLTTYLQQMLWEQNFAPSDSRDYYVDSLFRILLRHVTYDVQTRSTEDYHPYRFKLQNLRLELQAAPYQHYTAETLARRLDISPSYFQHLYKLFFHIPFRSDLIQMRIDYAKEQITSENIPLEQIAYACGYSSEVHFYRQFLAQTGMTPGEYRKQYTKKNQ